MALLIVVLAMSNCGRCYEEPRPTAELTTNEGTALGALILEPGMLARPDIEIPAPFPEDLDDPTIAWVEGRRLPRSQLERALGRRIEAYTRSGLEVDAAWRNRHRGVLVTELVEDLLLAVHLDERGIAISDEELTIEFERQVEETFRGQANLMRYLERRGISSQEYRDEVLFNLRMDRLYATLESIEVTEEEIRRYYDRVRESWRAPERVRASNIAIWIRNDVPVEELRAARELLEEVRQQVLSNPDSFGELALEHSQSPSRSRGGDLGWIHRDESQLDTGVIETIFNMAVGEVSEVIDTMTGYEFYLVTDHRSEGYRSLEEVHESLQQLVRQQAERGRRSRLLRELERRYETGRVESQFGLELE